MVGTAVVVVAAVVVISGRAVVVVVTPITYQGEIAAVFTNVNNSRLTFFRPSKAVHIVCVVANKNAQTEMRSWRALHAVRVAAGAHVELSAVREVRIKSAVAWALERGRGSQGGETEGQNVKTHRYRLLNDDSMIFSMGPLIQPA